MTNEMQTAIDIANAVAIKNDRWMFIATLLCFGVAVFFAMRWLVRKHEALVVEHRSDHHQYTTTLLNITAEQNRTARDLLSVLEKNTAAIECNTDIITKHQVALELKGH